MPRYSAVAPAALPRTEPSVVRTMGARPDPWPGEAVEAAAAQPASVAAARQATAAIRIRVLKPMGWCSHPRRAGGGHLATQRRRPFSSFPSRASGTGGDTELPRSHAENILHSAANYQCFRTKSLPIDEFCTHGSLAGYRWQRSTDW